MEKISEKTLLFGGTDKKTVLLLPVDRQEMGDGETYFEMLQEQTKVPFSLVLYRIDDWNRELSPWQAPPVYGKEPFAGEAEQTLKILMKETETFLSDKTVLIGGYSLAGFFALWAAYQTELFTGVAAVSPSVWYPGWMEYITANPVKAKTVYLSLGEKEERAKNTVLSTVGDCIRLQHDQLKNAGVLTTLEWNSGGHFQDPMARTVRGFVWLLEMI